MGPITRLKTEFLNTEYVKYNIGMQGMSVSETGIINIGNRAGPLTWPGTFSVKNLGHEMSHIVEINDERMRIHGYGLKLPEVWVYDRMCVEPTTHQITDRELRVTAYQCELLSYIDVKYSVRDLVGTLEYLADTTFVPLEDGSVPYGENKTHNFDYTGIKASQNRWRINEVNRLRKEYTMDRFLSEWNRKINWLASNEYVVDKD